MTAEGSTAHQARIRPRERLEKRLARVAGQEGIDQVRLRRWVSFLAICGVLERALEAQVLDGYYIKGGVAMDYDLPSAPAPRRISILASKALGMRGSTNSELL